VFGLLLAVVIAFTRFLTKPLQQMVAMLKDIAHAAVECLGYAGGLCGRWP